MFRSFLLLNTLVAIVGLVFASFQLQRSRFMAWFMVGSALVLTGPIYLFVLLGRIPEAADRIARLRFLLLDIAIWTRWPAYMLLFGGAVDLLLRRRWKERHTTLVVPTITPYGRSAFDSGPDQPPPEPDQTESSSEPDPPSSFR
jgi:hypothetical protein